MTSFTISVEQREVLGFQLNRRRRMREMTVSELANNVGVDKAYIKALEKGKLANINPKILMKLGEILGIHYLMLYALIGYVELLDLQQILDKASKSYIFFEDTESWA
jgi:transcriptional regulator with XRE-family HTH domain